MNFRVRFVTTTLRVAHSPILVRLSRHLLEQQSPDSFPFFARQDCYDVAKNNIRADHPTTQLGPEPAYASRYGTSRLPIVITYRSPNLSFQPCITLTATQEAAVLSEIVCNDGGEVGKSGYNRLEEYIYRCHKALLK